MKQSCDPFPRLSASIALLGVITLWFVYPPRGCSHHGDVGHSVVETAMPVPTPSVCYDIPDASSGSSDAQTPDGADTRDTINVPAPGDSVLLLEPVTGETASFLQVKKEFLSLAEADNYASDVLPAPWGDKCQVGVKGQEGRKRFVLLVGPFATRREASQAQRALTIKKIPTLFIDQDWQLRRFRSIEPLAPQDPTVSENIFALHQPAKPQGQAIFQPWPTCSQCLFCK